MHKWVKKIKALIASDIPLKESKVPSSVTSQSTPYISSSPLASFDELCITSQKIGQKTFYRSIPTESENKAVSSHSLQKSTDLETAVKEQQSMSATDEALDKNLKALKHLRETPRGTTPVESRIAAVQALLGDTEVFKTLKMLRWPQGVVCPRCHSSNVIKKEPPAEAEDSRHYYICLNCKASGGDGDFDDFTGLPVGSLHALRQWILCWYLMGFCSVNQISKVLGISVHQVLQMAALGSEIATLKDPKESSQYKKHEQLREKKGREAKTREGVDTQEERARSFSKDPTRPGPKSKL